MNTSSVTKGTLIAASVAALFGCATNKPAAAPSGETVASVRCAGINSCKGHGECATADHSCGKHTPCKGQGWLTVDSAEECAAKGGTVL
jgi:hypothetical protein